jgi:hypothetical protein
MAIAADERTPDGGPIDAVTEALLSARSDRCSVDLLRETDRRVTLTVRGSNCDGRRLIKVILDDLKEGTAIATAHDVDLNLRVVTLRGYNDTELHGVTFRFAAYSGRVREFVLTAEIGIAVGLLGELRLQSDGHRIMALETADAGTLLRFLGIYRRLLNGHMSLAVDISASDRAADVDQLEVTDFAVAGEWLRRLINPTPRSGNKVSFSRLHLRFKPSPGNLSISEGTANGPLLNATIEGKIGFEANRLALKGAIIPSYVFESETSSLDSSREGAFALSYEITGPLQAPTLHIDPWGPTNLRLLLRQLFERQPDDKEQP